MLKPEMKYIPVSVMMEETGFSERYFRRLIQDGTLEAVHIGRRSIRVLRPSYESFMHGRLA